MRLDDQPGQVVPVVHHRPGDGPVRPCAVRGLHDVRAVRLDVPAAVGPVDQRRGEPRQVDLVPFQLVLLSGAISRTILGGIGGRWTAESVLSRI